MNCDKEIIIISGVKNTGKTTLCKKIIDIAHSRGYNVSGILSPGMMINNEKSIINIEDIQTGENRLLAYKAKETEKGFWFHNWLFNEENLNWGNEILENSLPTDILIIDELGPIEFTQKKGLKKGITAIDDGRYFLCLVVIRSSLLVTAKARWKDALVVQLESVDLINLTTSEITKKYFY